MTQKEIELIGSTLKLFMKYGIKSLTMDDITRHLTISKKTLYQYVKDKKDLVCKSVRLMISTEQAYINKIAKDSDTAIDELIGITKCVSSELEDIHPSVIYDLQKYHPKAWQLIEEHKHEFIYNTMLTNLQRGIKEGYYRKKINPEIIAFVYVSMIDSTFNADNPINASVSIEKIHLEIINYHIKGISNETGVNYLRKVLKDEKNKTLSID